jgi:AraC-like DNA-binding protein
MSPTPQWPATDGLPASHVLQFVELLKRWGVSAQELFEGTRLCCEDLLDSQANVAFPTIEALVERARTLTREPALGIYIGLNMSLTVHGFLGFAAMCAPTLGESIALAAKYGRIRTTALSLRLEVAHRTAALVIHECADFGRASDVVLLGALLGLWQMGNVLLGREAGESRIHIALDEPSYYARFRHVAPRVCFGRPANELIFDVSLLNAPVVSADAVGLRLAREHCERTLGSVQTGSHFIDRSRRLVVRRDGGVRKLTELAAAEDVSVGTLKRRFAREGRRYSEMLAEERRARALVLLRSSELSMRDVAKHLGYSTASAFSRAFRRWTGQTPGDFREERQGPRH